MGFGTTLCLYQCLAKKNNTEQKALYKQLAIRNISQHAWSETYNGMSPVDTFTIVNKQKPRHTYLLVTYQAQMLGIGTSVQRVQKWEGS